jgi:hypothetical protein
LRWTGCSQLICQKRLGATDVKHFTPFQLRVRPQDERSLGPLRKASQRSPMPQITKTSAANPYIYHPNSSCLLVRRVSSPAYCEGLSRNPWSSPILSCSELDRSSSASKDEECERSECLALLLESVRCGCGGRDGDSVRTMVASKLLDVDQAGASEQAGSTRRVPRLAQAQAQARHDHCLAEDVRELTVSNGEESIGERVEIRWDIRHGPPMRTRGREKALDQARQVHARNQ